MSLDQFLENYEYSWGILFFMAGLCGIYGTVWAFKKGLVEGLIQGEIELGEKTESGWEAIIDGVFFTLVGFLGIFTTIVFFYGFYKKFFM